MLAVWVQGLPHAGGMGEGLSNSLSVPWGASPPPSRGPQEMGPSLTGSFLTPHPNASTSRLASGRQVTTFHDKREDFPRKNLGLGGNRQEAG